MGRDCEGGDLLPGSSRAKDPRVVGFIFTGLRVLIFVFQVCILTLPFGSSVDRQTGFQVVRVRLTESQSF